MTETSAAPSSDQASLSTAAASGSGSTDVGATAAAATSTSAANGAAAANSPSADSTSATQSVTSESAPSLISSAEGKPSPSKEGEAVKPETPAPAAEPKPAAKAADSAPKAESAKPDDPGKAEAKAEAATDPAKDATAIAPSAPVSLEDLKLPEGMKLEGEAGKAFIELLNKADLAPKDRAQGLMDQHVAEIKRVYDELVTHQRKVWDDTNAGWKSDARKEFGNRLDTVAAHGKAVVEELGGSPDEQKALLQYFDYTGAGNHPGVLRLLDNIARKLNIFEDGLVRSNPSAKPTGKTPGNRGWYDKSLNAQT